MFCRSFSEECPKCTDDGVGGLTCCGEGAAWEGKCGSAGDSSFEFSWGDGWKACGTKPPKKLRLSMCPDVYAIQAVIYGIHNSLTHTYFACFFRMSKMRPSPREGRSPHLLRRRGVVGRQVRIIRRRQLRVHMGPRNTSLRDGGNR